MAEHEEAFVEDDEIAEVVEVEDDALPPDDEESEAPSVGENIIDHSIQRFMEHGDSVFCVDLHPNEEIAVTGGGDDKAFLWAVATGELIADLDVGNDDSVASVAFSCDGEYVATGGLDGIVGVFDSTGALVVKLEGPDEVQWIAWHPKGPVLMAGAADCTVWLWSLPSGQVMQVLSGHGAMVTCGAFTPNGKMCVTGAEDGALHVWNPKTAVATHIVSGPLFHDGPVNNLAINSESMLALTASADNTACVVHLKTGKVVAKLDGHGDAVETVAWCNSMPLCATGSMDGQIIIWDAGSYQARTKLNVGDGIIKVLWHATEPLLYSCSDNQAISVCDGRSGEMVHHFTGHRNTPLDFAISRDGSTIVTAGDDGAALVFSTVMDEKTEKLEADDAGTEGASSPAEDGTAAPTSGE